MAFSYCRTRNAEDLPDLPTMQLSIVFDAYEWLKKGHEKKNPFESLEGFRKSYISHGLIILKGFEQPKEGYLCKFLPADQGAKWFNQIVQSLCAITENPKEWKAGMFYIAKAGGELHASPYAGKFLLDALDKLEAQLPPLRYPKARSRTDSIAYLQSYWSENEPEDLKGAYNPRDEKLAALATKFKQLNMDKIVVTMAQCIIKATRNSCFASSFDSDNCLSWGRSPMKEVVVNLLQVTKKSIRGKSIRQVAKALLLVLSEFRGAEVYLRHKEKQAEHGNQRYKELWERLDCLLEHMLPLMSLVILSSVVGDKTLIHDPLIVRELVERAKRGIKIVPATKQEIEEHRSLMESLTQEDEERVEAARKMWEGRSNVFEKPPNSAAQSFHKHLRTNCQAPENLTMNSESLQPKHSSPCEKFTGKGDMCGQDALPPWNDVSIIPHSLSKEIEDEREDGKDRQLEQELEQRVISVLQKIDLENTPPEIHRKNYTRKIYKRMEYERDIEIKGLGFKLSKLKQFIVISPVAEKQTVWVKCVNRLIKGLITSNPVSKVHYMKHRIDQSVMILRFVFIMDDDNSKLESVTLNDVKKYEKSPFRKMYTYAGIEGVSNGCMKLILRFLGGNNRREDLLEIFEPLWEHRTEAIINQLQKILRKHNA